MTKKKQAKKSNVTLKENGKFTNVYIKNATFYYAKVANPVDKYKATDGEQEYSVTVFVDEATKDDLEALPVNKNFFEVDVDKVKKGKNRGKIKYSSDDYEGCEGMFGFTVNVPSVAKSGKPQFVTVINQEGENIDKGLVGNGSKGTLKCGAWANDDGEYNLRLNLLMITDLVEYEDSGEIEDDELGVTYSVDKSTGSNKSSESEEAEEDEPDLDDDDIPFDTDEDDY